MTEPPTSRRDAWTLAALHAGLALYYGLGRGVTIVHDYGPEPWNWFWQHVPGDLLRERTLESLWHLHAQPPVWNALNAVLLRVFGGAHLVALQTLNVALGSATVALCVKLVARRTGSRRWAAATGAVVALHPALFLYEAYALYTTLVALGVVAAAWLLERAGRAHAAPAIGFVGVVGALVLTRSLFHLALLLGAVPLALVVSGRPTRRQVGVLAVCVLLPVAWYGKNAAQHGFFGASSWYGMGLWRSALFGQDPQRLADLRARSLLDPVVTLAPFSPPSSYRAFGHVLESDVPLLARDDQHNVNVPAISRAYARSARALILSSPGRYAANVLTGYGNFCAPSADFAHLEPNRQRIELHADAAGLLLLRPLAAALERAAPAVGYVGTLYFVLIPAVLLLAFAPLARVRNLSDLERTLRADPAILFLAATVMYTTAIGSALELGENVRFKFMIEPGLIVLAAVVAHRALAGSRRSKDAGSP